MFADYASWLDYCREYDTGPALDCMTECQICSALGQRECDTCSAFFCEDHIVTIRDYERRAIILEQICDNCQEYKMTSEPRRLLVSAADHQIREPFDEMLSSAIQQRFADLLAYGVGEWMAA